MRYQIKVSRRECGFSMLEVLVSLVLIAIALLGMAGLQFSALKLSKGAIFRTQAVLLSQEIAERIESNKIGATTGNYAVPTVSSTPATAGTNCVSTTCDSTQLAAFDLAVWQARIAATLPGSSWQISNPVAGNPSTYSVVVNWQDRRDNAGRTTYATTGTSETFSVTTTKVVSR